MLDKINKLTLPATIIIASLILGGFFYASQLSKQKSIEAQQQIELQAKKEADQAKTDAEMLKQADLSACLERADNNYQANWESYCISEGRGANCQSIKRYNADAVEAIEKEEKANCYKQYK